VNIKFSEEAKCYMDDNSIQERAVLLVEIVEGKNLFDFVNASSEPDSKVACYFIRQILDAITHFHNEVKFAHRDLKLDNIMLTKDD